MEKYKITFTARIMNAIGKLSKFTRTVEAENEQAAVLKLYEQFDHVHSPKINGKRVIR